MATVNRKRVVQEFFAWWGMYIIFLIALLLILSATGITHTSLTRDFLLGVDLAALGALMSVSHYYLAFIPFFKARKFPAYLLMLVCLVGVFVLLDALLLVVQTWGSVSFGSMLPLNVKHVLIVYVPLTIVHTISHVSKEQKNS